MAGEASDVKRRTWVGGHFPLKGSMHREDAVGSGEVGEGKSIYRRQDIFLH